MLDSKLKTFINLSQLKSYTKTASLLYTTQPSITQHIQALEKHYNIKLFYKENNNLRLTPQGELLYQYAIKAQQLDRELENALNNLENNLKTLNFGTTALINSSTAIPLFSNIILNKKDNSFAYFVGEIETIIEELYQGKIDFALIDDGYDEKNFNALSGGGMDIVFCVSKNHPLAAFSELTIDDLLNEKIIVFSKKDGIYKTLLNTFKNQRKIIEIFKSAHQINDMRSMKEYIINYPSVGIFYKNSVLKEIEDGDLIILNIFSVKLYNDFFFIYNKNHLEEERIRQICQQIGKI